MTRAVLRLYLIHCTAIIAIALSMYIPGLDLFLSIFYMGLIWQEGSYFNSKYTPLSQGFIGFLWQAPGIFLALAVSLGWNLSTDISYYYIFILELWGTPVLPLISLLPAWVLNGKPLYYYLLSAMVPVLIIVYLLPACKKQILPIQNFYGDKQI